MVFLKKLDFRFDGLQKEEQQLLLALYDPHQPEVTTMLIMLLFMIVVVMMVVMKLTTVYKTARGCADFDDNDIVFEVTNIHVDWKLLTLKLLNF